jgi:dTDP-4-amino-4,6-dideoxygalactose transaminase
MKLCGEMHDERQPNIKTYISNLKELSRVCMDLGTASYTNTHIYSMRTDDEAHGSGWSRAQTEHIYEITEKSPQQQFEGDMIASVFITL